MRDADAEPNAEPDDDLPPLTEAQRAELDRRLAEFEADPSIAVPWEVVRERLIAHLGGGS